MVKTIAKQARLQQKVKVRGEKVVQQQRSDLEKAQECMQIAAFVHGYNDAIVSLANHALASSHGFNAVDEYKYVQTTAAAALILPMEDLKNESGVRVALKLYQMAAEKGSKEAWFNLGHLYWTGHDRGQDGADVVEENVPMALKCFENAVDLGDDDARYFLSVYHLSQDDDGDGDGDGDGDDNNNARKRGLALVQEAGDNGHAGALYYLALLYRNGDAGLEIEPCLALFKEYLNEAADGDDADALFMRAHCLFHGEDGYAVDMNAALDGFVKSGEAGNADGFVSAGAMYHHGGYEVKKDQRRAFELYQQAGELGSIEGWKNVVACYALGEGVPRSEETAKYIAKTMLNGKDS